MPPHEQRLEVHLRWLRTHSAQHGAPSAVETDDLANCVSSAHGRSRADITLAYGPDGTRAKKRWALGATLYFDANAEYDSGTPVFTPYPHGDIKVVGLASVYSQGALNVPVAKRSDDRLDRPDNSRKTGETAIVRPTEHEDQ